uniref:Small ribosomal subunit protein uS2c n=1 Tax=Trachelomonas grandis TaxID=215769 RepID=A0A385UK09_9EUGL|nr:ribosomal protein S2 [Trachelomonas grandis]
MINLENFLLSGVHLGHSIKQWNPKMSKYIYCERNGIHIIDLLQTALCLKKVCLYLNRNNEKNYVILFVCTKKQFRTLIKNVAEKTNAKYVNYHWIGGFLTNWATVKTCIDKLKMLEKVSNEEMSSNISKKEFLSLKKKKTKLEKYLIGVKDMVTIPDIVIIIGQKKELIAIRECIKMRITLITIVDTNCDPFLTNYFIPANDDSISSISTILNEIAQAIIN